jgi:putative membrane protein
MIFRTVRRWFNPEEVRTLGSRPDYRYSLANERTFLAWIRTGLALLGGGLAVAGFLPQLRVVHLREAIAVVLLVLGGAIGLYAVDHWARSERAIWRDEPLPASRFPAVLAIALAIGAVLLVVILAVSGIRP